MQKRRLLILTAVLCLSCGPVRAEEVTEPATEAAAEVTTETVPAQAPESAAQAAASISPAPAAPGGVNLLTPESDPDICAHIGADYYLLTVSPQLGSIYANPNGRTFCPSTQKLGYYIGYTLAGEALVSEDAYTVADILGPDYTLLAYTPDRGNCYVNTAGHTFTPCTNEVGIFTGRNEDNLPIIEVTGIMIPVTTYSIYSTQGEVAPAGDLTAQGTAQPAQTEAGPTASQANALQMAKSYLGSMPFSYSGLVNQLVYEGFPQADAVYGASNSGADWNEQAVKKAASYLSSQAFSHSGLVEQLEYEGFTHDQAEYGVAQNGL